MKKYILKYCQSELNLKNTLINGQCFNWHQYSPNIFSGVLFNHYFEVKRLDTENIEVQVQPDLKDIQQKLDRYFYKSINLKNMYQNWIKRQEKFKELAVKLPGTRILKQDPWECTISFICSSNNNITRITSLLRSLKNKFGKKIVEKTIDGKQISFHQFPSLKDLMIATQDDLKEMGFGYRAEFIIDSVKTIQENGGEKWIHSLENQAYQIAKQKLMTLKGIGRKVADCICLFSLGCHSSVPIDTHMFQIAKKLGYVNEKDIKKSMSETQYKKIAQSYRDVYGDYAGWAQQIIFLGDLPGTKSTNQTRKLEVQQNVPVKIKRAK